MLPLLAASPVTAEILDALPNATDPFALSLNENPFPPLPAVRSALIRSIDVANRYPEFLPERLRRLIAGHIGVCDEQVVLGAGASGVVMQVLHAVTRPGDRIVLSEPTFDGYPIFAQMARLTSVTVPLDQHGHHDLEAMAEAAADARVVVLCRPHNPTGTVGTCRGCAAIPAAGAGRHGRAARRGLHRVCRPPAPHRRTGPDPAAFRMSLCCGRSLRPMGWPDFGSGTVSHHQNWPRILWKMQLPFGMGITSLAAVAASYDAEDQLRQRILRITGERDYLSPAPAGNGCIHHRRARQLRLPAGRRRPWREVFGDTGLKARHYPDGAARITVGSRASTQAVLAAAV